MDIVQLPSLVQEAISSQTSACYSDRQLSWKIQESVKGTLIQLVWKPAPFVVPRKRKAVMVGNNAQPFRSAENVSTSRSEIKKRNPPSRQRRRAKRLAEFLEKKKQLATQC